MIVTPEGLNVFPEDVERVLNQIAGVRDSAVVGVPIGSEERVHAVLVLEPGVDADAVVREANAQLDDHQKIRRALVWPEPELPRTEGTRKLKRAAIREWVRSGGAAPRPRAAGTDALAALVAKYAGRADLTPQTTLEELGLSSLERVELMVALEDAFQTRIDEGAFSEARDLGQLRALVERAATSDAPPAEPVDFPTWNRSWLARAVRRVNLPTWILPLARVFAWLRVEGREHLRDLDGPVIFASNHQSLMDGPVIMAALPRAMAVPRRAGDGEGDVRGAFLSRRSTGAPRGSPTASTTTWPSLFFNAFPLPQREAGARQTLRYIGELLGERHVGADLSGRAPVRDRRHRRVPSRHRDDCVASERTVVPVRHRRAAERAARRLAHGAAGTRARGVRRAAAAGGRRLRGARESGRGRRPRACITAPTLGPIRTCRYSIRPEDPLRR